MVTWPSSPSAHSIFLSNEACAVLYKGFSSLRYDRQTKLVLLLLSLLSLARNKTKFEEL